MSRGRVISRFRGSAFWSLLLLLLLLLLTLFCCCVRPAPKTETEEDEEEEDAAEEEIWTEADDVLPEALFFVRADACEGGLWLASLSSDDRKEPNGSSSDAFKPPL
jgi:hypothetical protein